MKSKYRNRKIKYKGILFDSKKELQRYEHLKHLEEKGLIKDLQLQVKFVLIPAQRINGKVVERECCYIADFVYVEDGLTVVEDVKGYKKGIAYSYFAIKRKLMLERYGIRIKEI